ncbi:uncharacterized protein LOC113904085 [Bos indicus x Bos taurus]|uniref:uncharacterized protein n=1 Tax=Bos taurus TaxID=9913 RepID=UPI000572C4B3|nr:PREDICTED: uncharacterized protein LOC109568570 [Bos indicus]XP_024857777.1 uncharacterized protein LOC112449602 [Bos taurus]XP_027416583.1 uncharacterized protein LOC113904085 [Bos indicus x Bos taurus]
MKLTSLNFCSSSVKDIQIRTVGRNREAGSARSVPQCRRFLLITQEGAPSSASRGSGQVFRRSILLLRPRAERLPPPARKPETDGCLEEVAFQLNFNGKEPARLWRICGIQHGGWSLRPPLPGALTSASRTSGSDDPPPQRRERPGSVGPLRVRRLHIPA